MPNTSHGLPYPAATDPVAGGAAAIQALAEATDTRIHKITGAVTAPGAVARGTGFAVNRTGTGTYVITYTAAFPDLPTVLAQVDGGGGSVYWLFLTAQLAGGFTLNVRNSAGAPSDAAFNFVAIRTL